MAVPCLHTIFPRCSWILFGIPVTGINWSIPIYLSSSKALLNSPSVKHPFLRGSFESNDVYSFLEIIKAWLICLLHVHFLMVRIAKQENVDSLRGLLTFISLSHLNRAVLCLQMVAFCFLYRLPCVIEYHKCLYIANVFQSRFKYKVNLNDFMHFGSGPWPVQESECTVIRNETLLTWYGLGLTEWITSYLNCCADFK